jgi:hypothetical protein
MSAPADRECLQKGGGALARKEKVLGEAGGLEKPRRTTGARNGFVKRADQALRRSVPVELEARRRPGEPSRSGVNDELHLALPSGC